MLAAYAALRRLVLAQLTAWALRQAAFVLPAWVLAPFAPVMAAEQPPQPAWAEQRQARHPVRGPAPESDWIAAWAVPSPMAAVQRDYMVWIVASSNVFRVHAVSRFLLKFPAAQVALTQGFHRSGIYQIR